MANSPASEKERVVLQIRMESIMRDKLEELALKQGVKVSSYVRKLILEDIRKHQKEKV